ncbi:MAG: hypothetical protein GTO18_09425 [Anaerolineales bacterium]|nr:hypothetical protein [Anaerolineales bacterium]
MTDRSEGVLSILATLLVLFVAVIDPRVSVTLAIALLLGYGLYKLFFVRNT